MKGRAGAQAGHRYNFSKVEKIFTKIESTLQTKRKHLFTRRVTTENRICYETQAIQDRARTRQERGRKLSLCCEERKHQEHKVNALASGADEGRDKLR